MNKGDYRECPKRRDPAKCEVATCCAACDYYYEEKETKMQIQENMTAEYYEGVIDGIEQFAHWKDGIEYVGTCGTTLKSAINEIEIIAERSPHVEMSPPKKE